MQRTLGELKGTESFWDGMWAEFVASRREEPMLSVYGPVKAEELSAAAKKAFIDKMRAQDLGELAGRPKNVLPQHKPWCGKLMPPPRPLRMVHPLVPGKDGARSGTFIGTRGFHTPLGQCAEPAGPAELVTTFSPPVSCSVLGHASVRLPLESMASIRSLEVMGTAQYAAASASDADIARVDAMFKRLAPKRIVLLVPHLSVHEDRLEEASGAAAAEFCLKNGASTMPDVTVFEFGLEPGPGGARPGGGSLVSSAVEAMRYIFAEEDRLAPGGARYAPGGRMRLGTAMPPLMARGQGVALDSDERIVKLAPKGLGGIWAMALGQSERLQILPPRLRWCSRGPFMMAEAACEDYSLTALSFHHPPEWPAGWYTVFAHFAL